MDNIDKTLVLDQLDTILFGIKLKDVNTIMDEINDLKTTVKNYREPYACSTCAISKSRCDFYKAGCRDCSAWR